VSHRLWSIHGHGYPWTEAYAAGPDKQRAFRTALDKVKPQLVVFEELWLHRYLEPALRSGASVILDLHNVEGVLRKKEVTGRRLLLSLTQRLAQHRIRVIEQDFVRKASQVWVCSQEDASLC
jgi:hypothetical protein